MKYLNFKFIITCILIYVFTPLSLYSQKSELGLQIGGNLTDFRYQNIFITDLAGEPIITPEFTFNINAYFKYSFNNRLGISIEPGYIFKAVNAKKNPSSIGPTGSADEFDVRLNFLNLPLLLNLNINEKFAIHIGPEFAYNINTSISPMLRSDRFSNKFELSSTIGVQYRIFKKSDIGMRFNYGLTSLAPKKFEVVSPGGTFPTYGSFDGRIKSMYFQLFARYVFLSKQ